MAISYVNDLRLSEMATGDNSGTWGTVTNTNLSLIGDAMGYGTRAIANASADNITIADGTADADRAMYLKLTGGGQACTVTLLPNTVSKVWMMENGTNSALTFTQGSGANVVIPAGDTKIIASDGGGSDAIVYDVFASLSTGDLNVTGATTITTADNTAQLTLISTDADANVGPLFVMNRNSSSPADDDQLGKIQFLGEDDADNSTIYGQIVNQIKDASNGTEDGRMSFNIITGGADRSFLNMTHDSTQAEVVINEESIDLDFRVESNGNTHMLFVDGGSDHVNIGTDTDYGGRLNIKTEDNTTNLVLVCTDTDANEGPILELVRDAGNVPGDGDAIGVIKFKQDDTNLSMTTFAEIAAFSTDVSAGTTDTTLDFNSLTGGSERNRIRIAPSETILNDGSTDLDFRIESDGNTHMLFVDGGNDEVLIGSATSDRSENFQVLNSGAKSQIGIHTNRASAGGSELALSHNRDTSVGSFTKLNDGDTIGHISFYGCDGTDINTEGARISAEVNGTTGTNDMPTKLVFSTTKDGEAQITEAMRISENQNVSIGNTNKANAKLEIATGNITVIQARYVDGSDVSLMELKHARASGGTNATMIQFQDSGGTERGTIKTTGSATAYNTSSDYRLKENVDYSWDATTRLKQLKPARFNFTEDDTNTLVDGFMAHEVMSIVPNAIFGEKDGVKTVTNSVLNSLGNVLSEGVTEEYWEKGKTARTDDDGNEVEEAIYPSDSTWTASKEMPVYQQIDQSKLVPLLVKTIQELEARITALES